ncbi:DUF1493 family protein [Spartinivicinus ruber]|uniref:DUF1493 family protein n=1 Tax=Spartinivicinus ruber TaxID=2683272 RepID=UPI0013D39617|nr:DUF1493 family protein [Spartinivicinus ruber]
MDKKDAQTKILAQAVYELRLLLSHHLGKIDKETLCEAVSAHLSYALHNEALAIIESRPGDFSIEKAIENIRKVDERFGEQFTERFQKLINSYIKFSTTNTTLIQELEAIFLEKVFLKPSELFPEARLEQDYGITGDDAWELFEAIHEKFGTDFSGFEFDQYFCEEGEGFFSLLTNRARDKHRKAFPVTIGHIFKVVESGKWFKPPQVRKA